MVAKRCYNLWTESVITKWSFNFYTRWTFSLAHHDTLVFTGHNVRFWYTHHVMIKLGLTAYPLPQTVIIFFWVLKTLIILSLLFQNKQCTMANTHHPTVQFVPPFPQQLNIHCTHWPTSCPIPPSGHHFSACHSHEINFFRVHRWVSYAVFVPLCLAYIT